MQGLTLEDVAAAGLYAMAQGNGGGGGLDGMRHHPPDPRDISECEGLLEVRLTFVPLRMSAHGCRPARLIADGLTGDLLSITISRYCPLCTFLHTR